MPRRCVAIRKIRRNMVFDGVAAIVATAVALAADCPDPNFIRQPIATELSLSTFDVHTADLDGDGDADIVVSSRGGSDDGRLVWLENDSGSPPAFVQRDVVVEPRRYRAVTAADLDGDGDQDIIVGTDHTAFRGEIFWYENDGGTPPVFVERRLLTDGGRVLSVQAVDVDGDGDLDVLAADDAEDVILWLEHDGGSPPAFSEHVVTGRADGARSAFAADIDGDVDGDVLVAANGAGSFMVLENAGGSPPEFRARLTAPAAGSSSTFAADLDGDLDIDLIAAASDANAIVWYDNLGGEPPRFTRRVLSDQAADVAYLHVVDLDGDADPDIVSAGGDLVLYHQSDGGAPPRFRTQVVSEDPNSGYGVHAADLDQDGDLDIVSASGIDSPVSWFQNMCLECGNAELDPEEECDDGNRVEGDGCGSGCLVEASSEQGAFLDPDQFESLGTLELTSGVVTFDTDNATVTGFPDGTLAVSRNRGVVMAVFTFDRIVIGGGATIEVVGSRPIALLSQSDIEIDVQIDLVGRDGVSGSGGAGRAGGWAGGGPGEAGHGPGGGAARAQDAGGGGGYGGRGGDGADANPGGPSYGTPNLRNMFPGSGGGGGTVEGDTGGGAGGGAIQLSAAGSVAIGPSGKLDVGGGSGADSSDCHGGGGGSGGSVLLVGELVDVAGTLSARGGDGGDAQNVALPCDAGGGGGGGRVALYATGWSLSGTVDVGGGTAGFAESIAEDGDHGSVRTVPR